MIQRLYLLVFALVLVSCTKDTDALTPHEGEAQLVVSTKSAKTIKEYSVNSCADESVYLRYHFNDSGRLDSIDLVYWDQQVVLSYDSSSRISNLTKLDGAGTVLISKDLIYDADSHLLSLGDRTFDFIEDQKIYIEEIILGYDSDTTGDIELQVNLYKQFNVTPGNPIAHYCEFYEYVYTNTTTGEVTINGMCSADHSCTMRVIDGNLTVTGCGSQANYEFDTTPNPLFAANSNLIYILGFLTRDTDFNDYDFFPLASKNNKTLQYYEPEDPESSLTEYRRSADGFPESARVQWYYVGTYEGSCDIAQYIYY